MAHQLSPIDHCLKILKANKIPAIVGELNNRGTARALTVFVSIFGDSQDVEEEVLNLLTPDPESNKPEDDFEIERHSTYANQIGGWTSIILWVYDHKS